MEQVKHYKIIEKLGSGGMGEVYKAFDSVLERDVAIKVMHRQFLEDPKTDERFLREARAAAKLVHPNIVTVYEVGKAECGRYIVMEFVEGVSLTEMLNGERGNTKPERAIKLMAQILSGLSCAHGMGILHRDIKPENIFITQKDIAKILDFGIAKMITKEGLTIAGDILGTVDFMAPEQMLGEKLDHRSDLFACGILLYLMLTGRLPFTGESPVSILYKQLNEDPVPPSYYNDEIGHELDQAVLKAIHRNKDERWSSADTFADAIEAILRSGVYRAVNLRRNLDEPRSDVDVEIEQLRDLTDSESFRSVFVGRDREFKTLVNLFSKASRGDGQTALLMGEAGVGKSSLAMRLSNFAKYNKDFVLYGACLYQDGMDAYLPFVDALRGFFSEGSHSLPEAERSKVKDMIREKVPLLMEFTERFTTSFGPKGLDEATGRDANREDLFEGISQLISLLSTIRPTVLIIDDLHWSDEASLRLFHYLSRQVQGKRLLLVGISRSERYDLQKDGKPSMAVDVIARIRRESPCEPITLYRLSHESCEELIDKTLSPALFTEEFYDAIYSETKGNPFFVLETLKLLRESGGIFFKEGGWYNKQNGLELSVPHRVEDVFVHRLSALNDEEREILQVAAVAGHKFDVSIVSRVIEIPKIKLLRILQRTERDLQILTSTESGFQFDHPMLRDLLYDEIPAVLQREYHLMIATEMEKAHSGDFGSLIGDYARHLLRGGQYGKAAPMLYQAASRAFKLAAYGEAALFFENFIDCAEHSKEASNEVNSNSELYMKLGKCYEEMGRWTECLDTYKKLLEMGEKQQNIQSQIQALERIGRLEGKSGELDRALRTYGNCLDLVKQHNVTGALGRIQNFLGIIRYELGDFDEALRCFDESLKAVDTDNYDFYKANTLTNKGIILNIHGNYAEALENYKEALETYAANGDRKNQARVYHNMGITYADEEKWPESIEAFTHCLELIDQAEDKQLRALIYLNMGKAYARQKDLAQAKKYSEKALKIFKRMGDIINVAEAYHVFGLIQAAKGNYSDAELFLKESLRINKQRDYWEGLAETYMTYGDIYHQQGDLSLAKKNYEKAAENFAKLRLNVKVKRVLNLIDEVNEPRAEPSQTQNDMEIK